MPDVKPITWLAPPVEEGEPPARIKTVSSSRLLVFEQCPRRAALAFISKVKEPDRPGESPLERGSRLHNAIEDYITGKTDELDSEVKHQHDIIEEYRHVGQNHPEHLEVEQRWNFSEDWQVVDDNDWDNIWFILKLDALAWISEDEVDVDDWKSGKKSGNEVKHSDQLLTYIISVFMRYPDVESVNGRLTYIDANETTTMELTREKALKFLPRLNTRLLAVTEATTFPPKPSTVHCRFCPFKTGKIVKGAEGTGHCDLNPV